MTWHFSVASWPLCKAAFMKGWMKAEEKETKMGRTTCCDLDGAYRERLDREAKSRGYETTGALVSRIVVDWLNSNSHPGYYPCGCIKGSPKHDCDGGHKS